jgi:hypothetical protein
MIDFPCLLHPLGVFDKVLLGFRNEPFGSIELGELQVGCLPGGRVAQHLVAHRDRVVVEPQLGVLVHRSVVIIRGLRRVLQLDVEIPDAVVYRQVGAGIALGFLRLQRFDPDLDGLLGVLRFEAFRLVDELFELGHGGTKIPGATRPDKANLLSRRRLRPLGPSSMRLRASHRRPLR